MLSHPTLIAFLLSQSVLQVSIVSISVNVVAAAASANSGPLSLPPQTPNLLEIVTGRCYERYPGGTSEAAPCPVIAPSVIAVLQSSLDHTITPDSFESYWKIADFSSPVDKAVFVIGGGGRGEEDAIVLPPNLVSPETTAGGALMKGLVFCGVDTQLKGCDFGSYDKGFSGAQASFWAGAYEKFAQSVKGEVRIVVGHLDVQACAKLENELVTLAAIPKLGRASTVKIFSQGGCDLSIIKDLTDAMDHQGIKFSCTVDPQLVHLFQSSGYLIEDSSSQSIRPQPVHTLNSISGLEETNALGSNDVASTSSNDAAAAAADADASSKTNEKRHHNVGFTLMLFLSACAVMVVVVLRKRTEPQNYDKIPPTVFDT